MRLGPSLTCKALTMFYSLYLKAFPQMQNPHLSIDGTHVWCQDVFPMYPGKLCGMLCGQVEDPFVN